MWHFKEIVKKKSEKVFDKIKLCQIWSDFIVNKNFQNTHFLIYHDVQI